MRWLKNLVLKIAAKKAVNALKLEDGPMDKGKSWYRSKGVLSAIVVILIGAYETARTTLAPQLGWNLPEIPPFIYTVLGALGLWGRISATQTITK